jgi:hypothetical protein
MMTITKITLGYAIPIALVGLMGAVAPTQAQEDLQQQVQSISRVDQVKQKIRGLIEAQDECSVGSCLNFTRTAICSAVGALDIRLDGKISSKTTGGTNSALSISKVDLDLMKLIFSQCEPTNYQYWNFDSILHVWYNPTPEVDRQVRRTLGRDYGPGE